MEISANDTETERPKKLKEEWGWVPISYPSAKLGTRKTLPEFNHDSGPKKEDY
jgi:hypothetical protein